MLAAHAPAVPIAAQQAIALRSPQLAYAPASVPSGYRYLRWKWDENASIMRLWFRNAAGKEIVFSSTWQYGKCAASRRQTLRIAGATVYWTHGSRQQQSWRCVPAPGVGDGDDVGDGV